MSQPCNMQYLVFTAEDGQEATLHAGPVSDSDAAYLRLAAAYLQPLSDNDYVTGPAALLYTMARYSYVLDGEALYWCIEWAPGLVIVRMLPDRDLAWLALRSPVPNFGGRVPLPEDGDPDDYEDDNNPQYNLVFRPWDAQYDSEYRRWRSFVPAGANVRARFHAAMDRVNALAGSVESRVADDLDRWVGLCKDNVQRRAGDGIRIRSVS
jgi:hypothetical protein